MLTEIVIPKDLTAAVKDIKLAILQARAKAAHHANAEALKLYFYVGGYISKKTRNAKWGSGAIDALSERLQVELPGLRGFSATNIKNMRAFFEFWADDFAIRPLPMAELSESSFRHLPSDEICALPTNGNRQMPSAESSLIPIRQMPSAELGMESLSAFLSVGFSQHREIVRAVQSKEEAWYYICASAKALWSYEQLLQHLRADDYRHIGALPNNFAKTLSPMALATRAVRSFRDEYLLELVNLDNVDATKDDDVDERVLSKALVSDVEKTIQALGGDDFCFMGREKRLVFEEEEFFIDLLFYHRSLRALIAVELKMGKFRPSYLGQLEFYLSALDALVRHEDENPSIGLLLCEKMNKGVVEFAVRDKSKPLGIATYKTLRSIPKPYKSLAPVIDGVRKVMSEYRQQPLKATHTTKPKKGRRQ